MYGCVVRARKPDHFGGLMAASSVTGVGPGDSNGKQKPELHSGCGCGGSSKQPPNTPAKKRGCYVKSTSGGVIRNNSGSAGIKSNSCF